MFTKTTLFDLKGELRTFVLMVVSSCFAVVSLAHADDSASPLGEDVIFLASSSSFEWLKDDSGESSASSSITPRDISLSPLSGGEITKVYDGTGSTAQQLDDSYLIGGGDNVGGLTGEATGSEVVGYNVGGHTGGTAGGLTGGVGDNPQKGGISGYNTGHVQPYSSGSLGGLVGYNTGESGVITRYTISDGTSSSSITPEDISLSPSSGDAITKVYDGTSGTTQQFEGCEPDNVLNWESFNVAGGGQLKFDKGIGTVASNGVADGVMGLGNRHEVPAESVMQFSIATSGRSVLITGAKVGSRCVLLNAQGRVVALTRIVNANFVVVAPQTGTYFVRIDSDSYRIAVK